MGQIVSEILFYQYKWLKKEDFLFLYGIIWAVSQPFRIPQLKGFSLFLFGNIRKQALDFLHNAKALSFGVSLRCPALCHGHRSQLILGNALFLLCIHWFVSLFPSGYKAQGDFARIISAVT